MEQNERASKARRWTVWLTLGAVVALMGSAYLTWYTVVDDAYISGRYAEHLADGYGMVFSAGEPPVEGYTNMLWTILLALGRMLGIPMIELMTSLGALFGAAAVILATMVARAISGVDSPFNAAAGVLLAMSPHLAVATTNGLESSMMVAAVLFAVWTHLEMRHDQRWIAGIACALLIWTRPEGIVVCGALLAHDLWRHRSELTKARTLALWILGAQGLLTMIRLAYYGAWVPNTFAAKSSFALERTFHVNGPYLKPETSMFMGLAAVFAVACVMRPYSLRKALVACLALGLGLIPLTVNLWMPGLRLFLPTMALVACLAAASLASTRRVASVSLMIILFCAAGLYHYEHGNRVRNYDWRHTVDPQNGTELAAKHLAQHAPEGAWFATRDAGVFAYFVGTSIRVAELHQRALTQPHPDGADAKVADYTPENPEFFASTVRRDHTDELIYGHDKIAFRRMKQPYVYLGRVKQHYHRFYDVYARADLDIPPLPESIVVNFNGPEHQPR